MFKQALSVFLAILATTLAHLNGAPELACVDMLPHHAAPEQLSPFPYTVTADPTQTVPNGIVKISLSGIKPFKGYFIQVRNDNGIAVGSFIIPPLSPFARPVDCFNTPNSAATHPNPMLKNNVVLQWKAPSQPGTYQIYATIAESYAIFWSARKADTIIVK